MIHQLKKELNLNKLFKEISNLKTKNVNYFYNQITNEKLKN